jgi:hypothetical protein
MTSDGYGDTGMRVTLKKLRQLNEKCGGRQAPGDSEPQVDFSQMTPYGVAQYQITDRMRLMRVYMTQMDELGPRATPTERVELSQKIRKEDMAVKKAMNEAKSFAAREKKQQDYETLAEHVKKTQSLYKSRFGGPAGEDVQASSYGSTNSRYTGKLSSVELDSDLGGDRGMYSIREDEEFQQFFQSVHRNDVVMDKALDRIGSAVTRLHDQALGIKQELKIQSNLIDDTERKIDNVSTKMLGLNKKLKHTIKQVDQDKMCCYFLCFIILLGIAGGIYFVLEKK